MRFLKTAVASVLAWGILLSGLTVFGAAESIVINDTVTEIPPEMGHIQERDDRTFVPVRFIMENLGCHVVYDDDSHTAIITSEDCTYLIQEGNSVLYILPDRYSGTEEKQMDTSAYIETVSIDGVDYGRMYVPIRFLAEAIGYTVGWDETTQTVTLTGGN